MGTDGLDGARYTENDSHDLRESLAITHGWLEVLFRRWDDIPEHERRELVAAALHGTFRMSAVLDRLDGQPIDLRDPEVKVADEFLRVVE
jgi:light-regulated signal transduction histidine kinase (bacteriophytochrome)